MKKRPKNTPKSKYVVIYNSESGSVRVLLIFACTVKIVHAVWFLSFVTLDHKTSHEGQFLYVYIIWKLNK